MDTSKQKQDMLNGLGVDWDFGSKLRALRKNKNLVMKNVAESLGVAINTYQSWETNVASPNLETVRKLCMFFQVSADYFLDLSPMMFQASNANLPNEERWLLNSYRSFDTYGKKFARNVMISESEREIAADGMVEKMQPEEAEIAETGKVIKMPTRKKLSTRKIDYFTHAVAAGYDSYLDDNPREKKVVFRTPETDAADYMVSVSGVSMEPTYHDGDILLVKNCDEIKIGEVGIFVMDGEALIKELGENCLISHNSNQRLYPPRKINEDTSIHCCGRVIGVLEAYMDPTAKNY